MNKDKVIKDLRERNDKLKNQYDLLQFRNWQLEHKQEKLKTIIKDIKDLTKRYMTSGYIYEYNGNENYYVDGEYLKGIVKILGDEFNDN